MRCVFCKSKIIGLEHCSNCGQDIKTINTLVYLSHYYYNKGLDEARNSRISQAIVYLKKSVALNKMNVEAMNLLGLCYFRKGEFTKAFKEWVYSVHVKPKLNQAQLYLDKVSKRKNFMTKINSSLQGYNKAIHHIEQDHEELAILQLKQVVDRLPSMIEAQLLLALLRIQDKDYVNAKRNLRKVLVIDVENETALKYLEEIEKLETKFDDKRGMVASKSATIKDDVIVPTTSFKEYSIGRTIADIVIGMFLGVMVMQFLVLPAIRDKNTDSNKNVLIGQSKLVEDLRSEQSTLKEEIAKLEKKNLEGAFKGEAKVVLEAAKSLQKSAEQKYEAKDYKGARADFYASVLLGNDGADIYLKLIEADVKMGDKNLAKKDIEKLKGRHPQASQNTQAQKLIEGKDDEK